MRPAHVQSQAVSPAKSCAARDTGHMSSFEVGAEPVQCLRYIRFEDRNDFSDRHTARRVVMPAFLDHVPDFV